MLCSARPPRPPRPASLRGDHARRAPAASPARDGGGSSRSRAGARGQCDGHGSGSRVRAPVSPCLRPLAGLTPLALRPPPSSSWPAPLPPLHILRLSSPLQQEPSRHARRVLKRPRRRRSLAPLGIRPRRPIGAKVNGGWFPWPKFDKKKKKTLPAGAPPRPAPPASSKALGAGGDTDRGALQPVIRMETTPPPAGARTPGGGYSSGMKASWFC